MTGSSTSISNATTACRQAFRTATRTPGLMKDEWAENRMADFNLWAAGAGASTKGKASLDHRLQTDPQTHSIVTNLVLLVKGLVENCITNHTPAQDGTITSSHDEIPPHNLRDLMGEVDQSLNQLVRVTVAIRKAGTQSRLQKADRSFNPRHPQILALRVHLMTILLARPEQDGDSGSSLETLKKAWMNEAALDRIQLRLIDANLRRRGRFIYAQRHAQKVGLGVHFGNSVPAFQSSEEKNQGARSHAGLTTGDPKMAAPKHKNAEAVQSTTTATAVDTPVEHAHKQEVKAPTTAPSVTSSKVYYPRPPPVSDAQTVFTCPCCCQSMPVTVCRGDKWKKHLRADILPYTCILSGCPRPEVLYMTRDAWTSHMEKEHDSTFQWVCHLCKNKDNDSIFRDRSAFRAHLEGQHGRDIKPHRIEMLLTAWRRKVSLELTHCPLCNFRNDDHNLVLNHSAEHVHSFSLRSLPWGPSDMLEGGENGDDDDGNYFNEYPYFDIGGSRSNSSFNAPVSQPSDVESQDLPDLHFEQSKNVSIDEKVQLTESSVEQVPGDSRGPEVAKSWLAMLDISTSVTDQDGSRDDAGEASPQIAPQADRHSQGGTSGNSQRLTHNDYTVAWLCALSIERAAAIVMLDERHSELPGQPQDINTYALGRIGDHNVVIACSPADTVGSVPATVANHMQRSFPALRLVFMVGIGGGAPRYNDADNSDSEAEPDDYVRDIRLGDVVIGCPTKYNEAVVQYDFGKQLEGNAFAHARAKPNKPPDAILTALSILRQQYRRRGTRIPELLEQALEKHPPMAEEFKYPSTAKDHLFKPGAVHIEDTGSCKPCYGLDNVNLVRRPERTTTAPSVHYGTIGSANRVMKNAVMRDQLAQKHKIVCFEVEGAGLIDSYFSLVIRGISDYADSHKNRAWQPYAAATAASCAKELLLLMPGQDVAGLTPINQMYSQLVGFEETMTKIKQQLFISGQDKFRHEVLSSLSKLDYNTTQFERFSRRTEGTGTWLLGTISFVTWRDTPGKTLYCPGIPGSGKTVLASVVIDHLWSKLHDNDAALAFIYCAYNDAHNADDLIRSLLKQMASHIPFLPDEIRSLYDLYHSQNKPTACRDDVIQALQSITSRFSRVYVVIDALDECSDDDRTDLLDVLNKFKPLMNILVTARPVASIEESLHWDFKQRIEAMDGDIATYIEGEITRKTFRLSDELLRRPELRSNIVRQVVARAKGVFWHAHFYVIHLTEKLNMRALIAASNNLPDPPELNY